MTKRKAQEIIFNIAQKAKSAYYDLSMVDSSIKNKTLKIAARLILEHEEQIIKINQIDLENAKASHKDDAFIDRLKLDKARIKAMSNSLLEISKLPDPVGKITYNNIRPNGLKIKRVTIPLGVIAIIYEARPNVTADAFALCLKSGNAAILKPGSESFYSSEYILNLLVKSLKETNLTINAVQILPPNNRALIDELLNCTDYIDVIIPRGGKNLIKAISSKTKIPIFKHLDGNCHTYIHEDADLDKAVNILYNAKLRRTGICGATESVVIDKKIIAQIAPLIEKKFQDSCIIKLEHEARKYFKNGVDATEEDFATEYLSNIFSLKIVDNLDDAVKHINYYSSKHTEAIITENSASAARFLQNIDSAIVMHNTSTQFADGGEFGLGAEIGIATGRMHARGPVGLEQLVTFKYLVEGDGQIRT